jgi:type I restriction enzyme S subunit
MHGTEQPMPLGEAVRFANGKAIKPGGEGRYPVFGSNGIIGHCEEFRHENGIIIGRVGAYCGSVVYCPERFWASDNTLVAFPANDEFDTKFLYYLLQHAKLSRFAGGAAQPLVTQTVLKQVEVQVPELRKQRRIAGILSAYDGLIENNQRRIRILEEMACVLYREWFVHFRFPGHETVPRVPSPLGAIPQGWGWRELSELGSVGRGKSRHRPRNEPSLYGGPYPFFQTGDIKDARIFLRINTQTYSEAGLSQSKLWQPGTLCITIAANIAETAILAKTGCFPDSVVGFVSDPEKSDAFYVKMYLDSIKQQMQNVSRGTTQDNLSLEKLLAFRVLSPPPSIIRAFRERVSPMLELVNLLLQKEDVLRQTRDLLLPRLLSGQVALA